MIALAAGPLSAMLDGFALRWLRWHGIELLRGIAFVVRDAGWGTYAPPIRIAADEQDGATRRLVLRATVAAAEASLDCELRIAFGPDRVALAGSATARGTFATNRTGFVVLHGERCVGEAVTAEHTDGTVRHGRFPTLISPHQPFLDLRALAHEPHPGVVVHCRLHGEAFEMEDHRNWSDAGFKTYCRPLREPWPFTIADGTTLRQMVEVTISTDAAVPPPAPEPRAVLTAGPERSLPRLGVTTPATGFAAGPAALQGLGRLRPGLLVAETGGGDDLAAFAEALRATGRPGAVLLGGTGDQDAAIAAVASAVPSIETLLLAEATPSALAQARAALPGARIGAGTAHDFAEFHRVPPPEGADIVFWTVTPTVHATDDASVMETLHVLGDQARTAAALRPGVERWVGPVTLRRRWQGDPRQLTAFGAAFLLGHVAAWAEAGITTVLLQEPFGPTGLLDQEGRPESPAGALVAGLAAAAGTSCRVLRGAGVMGLATVSETWLVNLTPEALEVSLDRRRIELEAYGTNCSMTRPSKA